MTKANKSYKWFLIGCSILGGTLISNSAFAQDSNKQEYEKEVIIVTATKRSENLQDVPISVTAFNAAKLERLNPDNLSDLANHVPNMYLPPAQESSSQFIMIRGLGAGVTRSGGRAVGVYVDGVYISGDNLANIPITDISSIEVLKGPQGTLFGRDTIGGAINITTRKPSEQFSGFVEADIGNFGRTVFSAGADVPLTPGKTALRLNVKKFDYGGHIKNAFNGKKADGKDQLSYGLQFYFTPNENFDARLSYNHLSRNDNTTTGENAGGNYSDQIPYLVNINRQELFEQDADSLSLGMNYKFANGYKFVSISGYSKSSDASFADRDLTPIDVSMQSILYDINEYSQEFRLESPVGKKFDYLVGVHYLNSHIVNRDTYPIFGAAWLANLGYPPFLPDVLDGQERDFTTKSIAAFAHANYRFTDKFAVFAGLRYSDIKKDINHTTFGEIFRAFGFVSANRQGKTADAEWSWTIGAKYAFSDEIKSYVTIANGFRSSSLKDDFITANDLLVPDGFATDPEFVTNYEAGIKARSKDGRFNADFAVFYMDYKDIQVSIAVPPLTFVRQLVNAAKAHISGFELDAGFAFTKNLKGSFSLGFLETNYDEFPLAPALQDRGFGTTPEWTLSAGLDYKKPVSAGVFNFHLDYSLMDVPSDFAPNRSVLELAGFSTMNGAVSFAPSNSKWLLTLWGKNLFDDNKPTGTTIWGAGLGLNQHSVFVYQDPRTFGATIKFNF